MQVQDLLEQIDALLGASVTVTGRLVVTGDDQAFLTSDPDTFDRRKALLIRDGSRIAKHLFSTLPAYGGGRFVYNEECVLTGTIERDSDSFRVRDVQRCTVRRDDREVELPVSG